MAELMDKQGILDELRHRSGGAQQEQTPMMDKQQILDYLRQRSSAQPQGTGTFAPVKQDKTAKDYVSHLKAPEQEPQKWYQGYLQKGAFADGYQFGDIYKTILGTGKDVRENLYAGVIGVGEKAIDAGAYLVGGAGKLFGADKFADDVDSFIKKDLINEEKVAKTIDNITGGIIANAILFGNADDVSVLGEKSDSLLQSGGQLAATAGLQMVGVPWYVTSGVTSFGGEAENALREGASYGEAGLSAAISAGAEILTEKLFGGSGLGEKGLINLDKLTKGISNKLVKTLMDYGVDMAAEGAEEVVSSLASNLGSSLYREENLSEILFSEEAVQGYIDSFVSGAALAGLMNVGKVVTSISKKTDYRNGLTAAEQKVFDKQYDDALKQAEKEGKVTNEQRRELYDATLDAVKAQRPATPTQAATPTQSEETAQSEKVPTKAETPTQDAQTAQTPSQPMTPQQAMQETIAETIGVPSVTQAVESFRQNGKVSNSQAEAIIADDGVFREILEMTGIAPPSTKSQTRAAVKQAIAKLAQESVSDNAKIASESTGADATIAETVVPTDSTTTARPEIRNDEAWEEYQRRLAQWEARQNQTGGFSSVGAANAGFSKPSPVDPLIEQYGSLPSGENPVRSDELPKSVTGQDRVSQTAVTVKGAQATPDDFVDTLDEDVAKGGMSYIPIKNSDTVRKASDYIKRNGWQQALANWNAAVDAGNSNADLVAQGALFYNNAVNAGDRTAALDILHSYQQLVRNSARGLQVARILKTLTPSDKLYMIEKTIRKFNEKTGLDIEVDDNLLAEYRALATTKDDALAQELEKVLQAGAGKAADNVLIGIESESLATRLGKRIANSLTAEAKQKDAKLEDILYQRIMRFVNDKAKSGTQQQTESTNENLRALGDYFTYQYLFQDAWDIARGRVEDALWQMDQNDPRVQTIKNFLVNGGEFGGIENTDPLSALDIYNQRSTLRKGTKEAAEKAGILMKNKLESKPKVKAKLRDILVENAANKQAAADLIAQTAVQELGLTGDEAAAISEDITRAFYQDLAEQSESRLESIFGKKNVTESQKLTMIQQLEQFYNMGAFSDPKYRAQAFQKVFGEDMDLDIPNHLLERLTSAEDAKRDAIIDEIKKSVADQLPSTFMDKVNALRYLNMLGNLKTQVRNIFGNATMAAVSTIKNEVGAGIELIANKVSGGKVKRTKSFGVSKEQLVAAKNDFDGVKEFVTGERRYDDQNRNSDDFMRGVLKNKRVFKSKALEGYRKLTSDVMEKGDLWFSKPAYARALAGYLKAQGITETDYSKIDQDILDEARLYAINEAQEQTFRDNNMLADAVSKRYRGDNKILKAGDALLNAIIPFRKTPANVLLRAEEYSPLGIANALWNTVQAGRDGSGVTANDAINSWAKSLTGTGLFFLGALLSNLGLLSAGADEDKEKEDFESLSGYQNYAFVARDGTNVTIDFLSPASIPLLMGAEFWEAVNANGLTLDAIWDTAMSMTEPMIQMSMLQSLNDTIEDVRYSDDPSGQIVVNAALNYLMQATTNTLFGQLERGTEDVRMTTYVDKDSPVPDWLQKALGKASAKTPIWEYNQIPYINAWGEEEKNLPTGLNLAYNLLSPGYVESGKKDATTEELNRLGTSTGENVYPDRAPTYITVKGERVHFSAEEYVSFAKDMGQTQKKLLEQVLSVPGYEDLPDAQKVKVVKEVYQYAKATAAERAVPEYDASIAKWMRTAESRGNLAEAIVRKIQENAKEAEKEAQKEAFKESYWASKNGQ